MTTFDVYTNPYRNRPFGTPQLMGNDEDGCCAALPVPSAEDEDAEEEFDEFEALGLVLMENDELADMLAFDGELDGRRLCSPLPPPPLPPITTPHFVPPCRVERNADVEARRRSHVASPPNAQACANHNLSPKDADFAFVKDFRSVPRTSPVATTEEMAFDSAAAVAPADIAPEVASAQLAATCTSGSDDGEWTPAPHSLGAPQFQQLGTAQQPVVVAAAPPPTECHWQQQQEQYAEDAVVGSNAPQYTQVGSATIQSHAAYSAAYTYCGVSVNQQQQQSGVVTWQAAAQSDWGVASADCWPSTQPLPTSQPIVYPSHYTTNHFNSCDGAVNDTATSARMSGADPQPSLFNWQANDEQQHTVPITTFVGLSSCYTVTTVSPASTATTSSWGTVAPPPPPPPSQPTTTTPPLGSVESALGSPRVMRGNDYADVLGELVTELQISGVLVPSDAQPHVELSAELRDAPPSSWTVYLDPRHRLPLYDQPCLFRGRGIKPLPLLFESSDGALLRLFTQVSGRPLGPCAPGTVLTDDQQQLPDAAVADSSADQTVYYVAPHSSGPLAVFCPNDPGWQLEPVPMGPQEDFPVEFTTTVGGAPHPMMYQGAVVALGISSSRKVVPVTYSTVVPVCPLLMPEAEADGAAGKSPPPSASKSRSSPSRRRLPYAYHSGNARAKDLMEKVRDYVSQWRDKCVEQLFAVPRRAFAFPLIEQSELGLILTQLARNQRTVRNTVFQMVYDVDRQFRSHFGRYLSKIEQMLFWRDMESRSTVNATLEPQLFSAYSALLTMVDIDTSKAHKVHMVKDWVDDLIALCILRTKNQAQAIVKKLMSMPAGLVVQTPDYVVVVSVYFAAQFRCYLVAALLASRFDKTELADEVMKTAWTELADHFKPSERWLSVWRYNPAYGQYMPLSSHVDYDNTMCTEFRDCVFRPYEADVLTTSPETK